MHTAEAPSTTRTLHPLQGARAARPRSARILRVGAPATHGALAAPSSRQGQAARRPARWSASAAAAPRASAASAAGFRRLRLWPAAPHAPCLSLAQQEEMLVMPGGAASQTCATERQIRLPHTTCKKPKGRRQARGLRSSSAGKPHRDLPGKAHIAA